MPGGLAVDTSGQERNEKDQEGEYWRTFYAGNPAVNEVFAGNSPLRFSM
jgi:hypothetical protein